MNISLICTTKNEEKTIRALLGSIAHQTLTPSEVIIVDSHSSDHTLRIIKDYKKNSPLHIRLFKKKSNRSSGRNFAVNKAKYSVIAVTDAGCVLDKHWLELITAPIRENKAESVAGYYLPITPTPLQKAVAPFVSVMPQNLDTRNYLPSSRSVAFTKKAWKTAGKFPKHLNFCEDLVFAQQLKSKTKMTMEKRAIVYWIQAPTYSQFFSQIKHYAQGDVEADYWPHVKKIATVYLRYIVFVIVPATFPPYLLWSIVKHWRYVSEKECLIYTPALQVTSDFAVMLGAFIGLVRKFTFNSTTLFSASPATSKP